MLRIDARQMLALPRLWQCDRLIYRLLLSTVFFQDCAVQVLGLGSLPS
jgi:hypothetical protein